MTRSVFLLWVSMTLGACATERPFVWATDLPGNATPPDKIIRPGDTLAVFVRDHADYSNDYPVRENGNIADRTIGEVPAAGRSVDELAADLQGRLARIFADPEVTVSISRVAPIRVNVVGEVKTPDSYELTRDRSVAAALAAAGWLTEFADRDRIFVIRHDANTRVRFHERDITAPNPATARFRLNDGDVVVAE
jgi:polysaccharide export outer membrane protein